MNVELISALTELEKERGISKDVLIEAIETAIVSAYKKNYGTSSSSSVRVEFNQNNGAIRVFSRREVVDEVEDSTSEISLENAKEIDPNYKVDDVIEDEVTPSDFGRIAAQTAKQVVIQKIREAERSNVYDVYSNREGDVVSGTIQQGDHRHVIVDLGDVEAVLPLSEQIPGEEYVQHSRLRFYINEVRQSSKGPQVFLSRTHPGLLKALFEFEVPEIQSGEVEIKSVAREAGNRSKIAVYSRDDNIDPVGACVGSRGSRVQSVVSELGNERIDIVEWVPENDIFIKNALSPAKVLYVHIDEEEKVAHTVVPNDQLSLAIGKAGQNARLAARLTGWRIDIKDEEQAEEFFEELEVKITEVDDEADIVEDEDTAVVVDEEKTETKVEGEDEEEPVVQEISEEDLASLTNVVKRKSWQERFGQAETIASDQQEEDTDDSDSEVKQETDKSKKKKDMIITDLSQLDSIDFKFDGKK